MRLLIISDIHANLPALDAVLKVADGLWDQVWCLGDLVGYGPNPNECVAKISVLDHVALSGNHDWAALDKLDIGEFNEEARAAVLWTRSVLSPAAHDYLDALPPLRVQEPCTLAHGSPRHPVWEYVLDFDTAAANFDYFDTPFCLIGHSHIPLLVAEEEPDAIKIMPVAYGRPFSVEDARFLINPGSVGQPRDGDPRAAFALFDLESLSWEFRRISYPIEETQRQMRRHGLPDPLADRLSFGW